MPEPALELVPSAAPLIPTVLSKQETVFLLLLKEVVELLCRALVENYGVLLPVPSQAS